MRKFGIIPNELWSDPQFQALNPRTRLVGFYLYAGPHVNTIGCYRLPLSYIEEDLRIEKRFVRSAIEKLAGISFLRFHEPSKFFVLNNFLRSRAKKWLANPNNYIAATRELDEIPESVPFKEEIRLQLVEIKRGTSNDDTNGVLTPSERRTNKGEGEEEGDKDLKRDKDLDLDAQGAMASLNSAQPDSSFSSFVPLPKSFPFPLKNGGTLEVDSTTMDSWQARFPHIVVPVRLQKHQQWFINNPHKRLNEKGTQTALLKFLQEDESEARKNRPRS